MTLKHTPVAIAVSVAILGLSVAHYASAQTATADPSTVDTTTTSSTAKDPKKNLANTQLPQVIVTSSKRPEAAHKVPYNVSVLTEEQLREDNITDAKKLISQSVAIDAPTNSARFADSVTVRGLNISPVNANNLEQFAKSTLAYYMDDTPLPNMGYRIKDVGRVETLLGPQGTLYGAGSLGGTIRFITNKPKLGVTEGRINTSFYQTRNGGLSNDTDAVFNLPVGDNVALRASVARLDEAGFTDRVSNPPWRTGSNAWSTKPDAKQNVYVDDDWQKVTGGRFSALWKLNNDVSLTLAHTTQDQLAHGTSGVSKLPLSIANAKTPAEVAFAWKNPESKCTTNCTYTNSFLAPNAVDDQTVLSRYPEFADRKFRMNSVDLDWNLGFAALHSSTSVFTDSRVGQADYASQGWAYYSGEDGACGSYCDFGTSITSDRSSYMTFDNTYKGLSHETRLTSNKAGAINWIAGFYHTTQEKSLKFSEWVPGMEAYLTSIGSAVALKGGRPGEGYFENLASNYKETAVFGEVGVRATPEWLTTVGGRFFNYQDQVVAQIVDYAGNAAGADRDSTQGANGKSYYKLNTSYQLTPDLLVYGTWSQGFRRGGTNAFRNDGSKIVRPELQSYAPDSTDNKEVGLKGFLFNRQLYLETDVYQIDWKDVQTYRAQTVGGVFPLNGTTNGPNARTQGFEFSSRLRVNENWQVSYSATKSVGTWTGTLVQPLYSNSTSGTRTWSEGGNLGGAPAWKHNVGVRFSTLLNGDYYVSTGLSARYTAERQLDRSDSITENASISKYPAYTLVNGNVSISKGDWDVNLWAQNITNVQAIASNQESGLMGARVMYTTPTTVGASLSYKFK